METYLTVEKLKELKKQLTEDNPIMWHRLDNNLGLYLENFLHRYSFERIEDYERETPIFIDLYYSESEEEISYSESIEVWWTSEDEEERWVELINQAIKNELERR